MITRLILLITTAYALASDIKSFKKNVLLTTAERIQKHGYPVEEHIVQTADGYLLTMFRIPYTSKLKNQSVDNNTPVVLLQHGLLSSSDGWIINGPNNSLVYLLADAGYDVWLGNFRGNTYSTKHMQKSPYSFTFWRFSWHEMGIYDLPAQIDYVLHSSKADKIHYIGHSQGGTAFFVMLSILPEYQQRLKTTNLLAPACYISQGRSPIFQILKPLMKKPPLIMDLMGSKRLLPNKPLLKAIPSKICNKTLFQVYCNIALSLLGGFNSRHMNSAILTDILAVHPSGVSLKQVIHYLQLYLSGHFRQYDYGELKNRKVYGSASPPDYVLTNIRPAEPINIYYGENDNLVSPEDLQILAMQMGQYVKLHRIEHSDWTHLDFLWGLDVKTIVYDKLLASIRAYEQNYSN